MFTEHPYLTSSYQKEQIFSPEECLRIIAADGPMNQSTISSHDPAQQLNRQYRNSNGKYLEDNSHNHWIYARVMALFQRANQRYYHFDVQAYHGVQVLQYETNGFYNWHIDVGRGKHSNRKLSLIVFLSAPQDYEGGQLEFMSEPGFIAQTQGKALIFPPFLPHRVLPVTKGIRYSLVSWAYGPHFR